ncbi:MAG TPA: hypothetical protein VJ124_06735 [Pyrinomonadaceae bacterium]|nr:hypothetical protein [Pyrinomonadaceae bacterium]
MIVAGTCITVAAGFMLLGNFATAFVIATVGIVAWFLNYRMQMKEVTTAAELQHKQTESEDLDET